jgi:hypothetical protein
MRQQQQAGIPGIGHQRIDRMPQRNARGPGGNLRQPFFLEGLGTRQLVQHPHREIAGGGQRIGNREVTQFLLYQHPVQITQRDAAERFRHGKCGQALIGELGAQIGRATALRFPDLAQHFRRRFDHQELADCVAEGELLFFKGEVHAQALGSPSMRSAIMLRWISLVPA